MKKPISSPSRADNFPPPLLRFLRSNGSSKSRGRSRSSPIFIRKKIETQTQTQLQEQEPSSPKVTCMGQVRVKRSNQNNKKRKIDIDTTSTKTGYYQWFQKTLFCCHIDTKSIPKASKKKGVFPFYRKRLEMKEVVAKPEEIEETTEEEEEEDKAEVFITSTPPKNALMLMRCRSEPYRASSLANRFWGSPSSEETEQKQKEEEEYPTLEKEPTCRDSAPESRTDPETEEILGFCQGLESSSSSITTTAAASTTNSIKNEAETSKLPARPLLLTRCKSEPARRAERFEEETCFWKKRLGFV